jgi:hypothetical protein
MNTSETTGAEERESHAADCTGADNADVGWRARLRIEEGPAKCNQTSKHEKEKVAISAYYGEDHYM